MRHTSLKGTVVAPTPVPTQTPQPTPTDAGNSFSRYGQGLNACFQQYLTDSGHDVAGCLACINAVDATGLDPKYVSQYLEYATNHCEGR